MNDEDILDKYGLLAKSGSPKKAVTESDELLLKHGLIPVEETSASKDGEPKWWQGLNKDNSYEGVAKRFGIGIVRGAKDVLDTAAHGLGSGISYIADKALPEDTAKAIRQSVEQTKAEDLTGRNEFNKEYSNSSAVDIGRTTGQIAATLPVMPSSAMTGIAAASKALPTITATGAKVAAPLVNRLVSAAGQGALGGAVVGGATSSANDKSLSENIGEGALTGGLAGPLLPVASSVGKGMSSKLLGEISPERAALAKKAQQYGIDLDASQVSESPIFKKYNQVSGWLPFSGAQKASDQQIGQFTKAVSNTFGENTENITAKALKQARSRIGNDYETVGKNTTISADNAYVKDLAKIYKQSELMLNDQQMKIFQNHLEELANKFDKGNMGGDVWQHFRRSGEPLSKAINNNAGTDLGDALKGLKIATDQVFKRSAPPDMFPLLQQADRQYANMKTIEKLALNDPEGNVSPLKLMSKVVNSGAKLQGGPLSELADIGKSFFPKPADSGTPLGEAVLEKLGPMAGAPLSAAAAGAHALASGGFILPTLEGIAGLAANRGIREAVNSDTVKNAIIRKAQGNTYGFIDKASEKAIPYSSQLLKKKNEEDRLYVGRSKLPVALTE